MSVRVAVRARPLNAQETEQGSTCFLRMHESVVEALPLNDYSTNYQFAYDHAYWSLGSEEGTTSEFATQEKVFDDLGILVLDHTFTGYNSCIFAYGQTGSGKTYCMMGTPTDEGLIPRIAQKIFGYADSIRQQNTKVAIEVSYLEIYCEKVRCLLDPQVGHYDGTKTLKVREHPITGPYVDGLARFVVNCKEEFLKLMGDGNSVRTTASTNMNAHSSRSHAIFTVTVTQKTTQDRVTTTKISKMNLVDLAGSERAEKTNATGKRLTEGSNINKSLSVLGNVIRALTEEGSDDKRFVPYRDSTLTWILRDNLGGNSQTVMLATVSPASAQYEETMSTLRYAERAKRIVNKAVINESNDNAVIAALQTEIEKLRQQLVQSGAGSPDGQRLADELLVSEQAMKLASQTYEEKLKESARVMAEREEHMAHLKQVIEQKDREISDLSEKLGQMNETLLKQERELQTMREGATPTTEANLRQEIEKLHKQLVLSELEHNEQISALETKGQPGAQATLAAQQADSIVVEPCATPPTQGAPLVAADSIVVEPRRTANSKKPTTEADENMSPTGDGANNKFDLSKVPTALGRPHPNLPKPTTATAS